jgi:hypothetical protein
MVEEKKKGVNKFLVQAGIVTLVFSVAILAIGFCLKPFVNYEGATNGMSIYGTTYELQYETIPTVINGMTAVTSIIIGFSGAMVSLVYREHFKKDPKAKLQLLGLAFYSAIPLTMLAVVYNSLIFGALEFSLKFALYALLLSLAFFIISMLTIFYSISLKDNPESGNNEKAQKKEAENRGLEKTSK